MVHIVTVYKLVNNGRVQILLLTVGQAGVGMGYLGMVEMGRGGCTVFPGWYCIQTH